MNACAVISEQIARPESEQFRPKMGFGTRLPGVARGGGGERITVRPSEVLLIASGVATHRRRIAN